MLNVPGHFKHVVSMSGVIRPAVGVTAQFRYAVIIHWVRIHGDCMPYCHDICGACCQFKLVDLAFCFTSTEARWLIRDGDGGGVGGGGGEDQRVKTRSRIPPKEDWRNRGPPPEQWKC